MLKRILLTIAGFVVGVPLLLAMVLVHVVTRYMEDGEYKWDYPRVGTTTMERICRLPDGA